MIFTCASNRQREFLLKNWFISEALPAQLPDHTLAESLSWTALPELMSVAAALRQLDQWTIDNASRRFDAKDWWYKLKFDMLDCDSGESIVLNMGGLATLARVWLNGNLLLTSSNMFIFRLKV